MAFWTAIIFQTPIVMRWAAKSESTCAVAEQEVRQNTA